MSSSSVNQPVIFERTSRFMRWLCKLFKGGSANRNVPAGRPQSLVEEDNMFRRPPLRPLVNHSRASKEKEELDRSIARSLAKDSKRPNGQRRQGTGKDEDLARSLHDNINSSSYPPPHAPSHAPWDYNARGCSYGKANQHNIIQEEVTCYMLFAEDIVLIDENNESVNNILAM